ncbi:hypothetical protein CMK11_00100 [Candidatus Poribacteria bacterium]|nr:hypothetical protein [Candidatus Poribacteria bacterium]
MASKLPAKKPEDMNSAEWYDALIGLTGKAQKGDRKAREDIVPLLAAKPDRAASLNWDESARRHLLEACIHENDASREMIPYRVTKMRKELTGDGCTPIERLLIERILTCWTHVHIAELKWSANLREGMTFQAGDCYQRVLDRAHRRYVYALRALAQVRKLLGPSVGMLNVVQNQTVSLASREDAALLADDSQTSAERSSRPVTASRMDGQVAHGQGGDE